MTSYWDNVRLDAATEPLTEKRMYEWVDAMLIVHQQAGAVWYYEPEAPRLQTRVTTYYVDGGIREDVYDAPKARLSEAKHPPS